MGYWKIFNVIIACSIAVFYSEFLFSQQIPVVQDQRYNQTKTSIIEFEYPERKDPFVAGVLSLSWCGLGQFYTQKYAKGSAFLSLDLAQKVCFVYMLFHISNKYSDATTSVQWSDVSVKDKAIVVGLLCTLFITRIISVVDAVESAYEYNKTIYYPYWKSKQDLRSHLETIDSQSIVRLSYSFPVNFK